MIDIASLKLNIFEKKSVRNCTIIKLKIILILYQILYSRSHIALDVRRPESLALSPLCRSILFQSIISKFRK